MGPNSCCIQSSFLTIYFLSDVLNGAVDTSLLELRLPVQIKFVNFLN